MPLAFLCSDDSIARHSRYIEQEHGQDRDQSLQPLNLAFLETGSDTECICFADSAMIMHVVPESAEVSSCGLRNISRVAVHCI